MKISYYSARDTEDRLTGKMVVDISDKSEKKLYQLISKIEEYGYKCAYCPNEEDGIFSDSFCIDSSEKKDFTWYYNKAKKESK